MYRIYFLLLALAILNSCSSVKNAKKNPTTNSLTSEEQVSGWQLLFDGNDLKGWHSYLSNKPGTGWKVQNGNIFLDKTENGADSNFADLVSDGEFENFDLKVEWKMEPCANSGLMFFVHESPEYKETYFTGPEMQIADLACSPDSRILNCRAGDLYDLISVDTEWVTTGGKWNEYEIKSDKGRLQLFQNGHKVIETDLWDTHWGELISKSKFADMPNFGTFHKGHISFQGKENGKLWFRNIKIKIL